MALNINDLCGFCCLRHPVPGMGRNLTPQSNFR